jgi:phosphoserine phosphatase RsbU/P
MMRSPDSPDDTISRDAHELEIEKNLRIQRALNDILRISLTPISLLAQLHVKQKLKQREASLLAARRIMDHLLPAGPLVSPELSIRGACFAADHAPGDYFNFFPLSDGSILAVVADVSGHGIEAALLVTVIHGCLRACTGLPLGLEETINRLNAVLFNESEDDSFCTMTRRSC